MRLPVILRLQIPTTWNPQNTTTEKAIVEAGAQSMIETYSSTAFYADRPSVVRINTSSSMVDSTI
jgi:hypothetical protein